MKVRTVLLSGFHESADKAGKTGRLRVWRRHKRLTSAEFREGEAKYRNEWRKKNPEKWKAQQDRYREKHRERLRMYMREYYQNNEKRRAYVREKAREYYRKKNGLPIQANG